MNNSKNYGKKRFWRMVMITVAIFEVILVVVICKEGFSGQYEIPFWQSVVFTVFTLWIYIAYLKQRHIDISKGVVDEKIRTHSLIQSLREGVLVLDPENRLLTMNEKAEQVTGLSVVTAVGADLATMIGPSIAQLLASGREGEADDFVNATGQRIRFRVTMLPADAEGNSYRLAYVWPVSQPMTKVSSKPVESAGIARAAAVFREIGSDISKVAFSTGDIRRQAELIRLSLRCFAYNAALECSSLRLAVPAKEGTSLRSIMEDIMRGIEPSASACEVRIELSDDGTGCKVRMNGQLIAAIGRLLLANAVLESPAGSSIRIRIGTAGPYTGLSVSDNGVSVGKEFVQMLFSEPYEGVRAPDSGIARTASAGYLVIRKIVESAGGTMVAESPAAGGLVLSVMFPAES